MAVPLQQIVHDRPRQTFLSVASLGLVAPPQSGLGKGYLVLRKEPPP
jgi:hypothetical protein